MVSKFTPTKSGFKNKKVLIFGLGLNMGGVGSAKFFASLGASVKVTDLKSKDVLQYSIDQLKEFPDITYTLGKHENNDIDWADIIIKNPAIKPGNMYIEYAKKTGKAVDMDMGIFLQYVKPSQIIGITGTKGKSTTSSLIYEILKSSGKHVILAGNIGRSVLETIPKVNDETLIVLELSSFQLESFDKYKISPKYAVITNIYPDHLNYYSSMEQYIQAKRIIVKFQDKLGALFLKEKDPITTNNDFTKDLKGQINLFSTLDLPKDFKSYLQGEHNKENMAAALKVAQYFLVDEKLALKVISEFKGVPFRQQQIMEWNGVKIINDTAATSPEAGIMAVRTFPNSILICGGMNKKMDYKEYVKTIEQTSKKIFFLEGDSSNTIKELIKNKDLIAGVYNNLENLLRDVKKVVKDKDIILFSPAATSFNLFQNEFDRGRKFNEAVQKVFR